MTAKRKVDEESTSTNNEKGEQIKEKKERKKARKLKQKLNQKAMKEAANADTGPKDEEEASQDEEAGPQKLNKKNKKKDAAAADSMPRDEGAKTQAQQRQSTTGITREETNPEIEQLEEAYNKNLAAFKANKGDKDLRRAKTAARRALDDAIAASTAGEQLTCRECSKTFIFTTEEQEFYKEQNWEHLPKRCKICQDFYKFRISSRESNRAKVDSSGKNMCYAFQRGECDHGDECKFSHNIEHAGKRSFENTDDKKGKQRGREDMLDDDKTRKEASLKKNTNGWRNK